MDLRVEELRKWICVRCGGSPDYVPIDWWERDRWAFINGSWCHRHRYREYKAEKQNR